MMTDNILDDDVLESIDQVLDSLDDIVAEIRHFAPDEYREVIA